MSLQTMLKKIAPHVGIHIALHPKSSAAVAMAIGKVAVPYVIAAGPYLLVVAVVAGIVYGLRKSGCKFNKQL